jgi:hypothetical protein
VDCPLPTHLNESTVGQLKGHIGHVLVLVADTAAAATATATATATASAIAATTAATAAATAAVPATVTKRHDAARFLHLPHNFELGRRDEVVPGPPQMMLTTGRV